MRKNSSIDESIDPDTNMEIEFAEVLCDLPACFNRRHGLIFANSRNNVEWFADALNHRNETGGLPRSYLVHYGSVSSKRVLGFLVFSSRCQSAYATSFYSLVIETDFLQ